MLLTHKEDILAKVEDAMKWTCSQSLMFTNEPAEPIATEYLFTVAVSSEIAKLNGYMADPYLIRLERDAVTFAEDCLRPYIFGGAEQSPRRKIIRRGRAEVAREGRIDVTVYTDIPNNGYPGYQPLCAIEVKGFDPQVDAIMPDLHRNLSLLRVKGATGGSVLSFAVFAAFHSYARCDHERHMEQNERRVRKRYENYLKKLGDLSDIKTEVRVVRVSAESIGRVIEGPDYDELDTNAKHHFVGGMVIMSRGDSVCRKLSISSVDATPE